MIVEPQPTQDPGLTQTIARLEKLLDISRALNANLDLDNLLLSILDVSRELTQTEDASILLLDRRAEALYFEATTSHNREILAHVQVPLEESLAGWIVNHGQPLVLDDAARDDRHFNQADLQTDFTTKALLGVPLQVKGHTIGVLEVLNPRNNLPFSDEDIRTITLLAAQAAVAIENARLFEQSDQIAEVVHELRTPLAAIRGFSELLLHRPQLDAETKISFLATINQETERLEEMINQFLDLARLETRRKHLTLRPMDLTATVQEAITLLTPQVRSHQLHLSYTLPSQPLTIIGDPARLKQVLVNLMSNAIKYNRPNGRISLCLHADRQEAEIHISDTGLGIAPEAINHIFDKFYRVTDHQDRVTGTGLGLAIVKEIVETHGGSIDVHSQPHQGSTFILKLPWQSATRSDPSTPNSTKDVV